MVTLEEEMFFGDLLTYFLDRIGMTQSALARSYLGIDTTLMNKIVQGHRPPSPEMITNIARACRLTKREETSLRCAADMPPTEADRLNMLAETVPALSKLGWPGALFTYRYELVYCNPAWKGAFLDDSPLIGLSSQEGVSWLRLLFDPHGGVRRWIEERGKWIEIVSQQINQTYRATQRYRNRVNILNPQNDPSWRREWRIEIAHADDQAGEVFRRLWDACEALLQNGAPVGSSSLGQSGQGGQLGHNRESGENGAFGPGITAFLGSPKKESIVALTTLLDSDARYRLFVLGNVTQP